MILKLRTKAPITNLDAMKNKDAYLTATFSDIKVFPFSGIIRYFGEFWDYDANGQPIEGSMREVQLFIKKEDLDDAVVDYLFSVVPVDFTQGAFTDNLLTFTKNAFVQKVVEDGRYGLSLGDVELIEEE